MSEFREPWHLRASPMLFTRDGGAPLGGIDLDRNVSDRIVACVNALAGIPTEEIEQVVELWKLRQRLVKDFTCNDPGSGIQPAPPETQE